MKEQKNIFKMKIPDIFVPEKKLDNKVESFLDEENFEDDGLAIAVRLPKPYEPNDTGKVSRYATDTDGAETEEQVFGYGGIYVWDYSMKEPVLVRRRDGMIMDLCYANKRLYDCGSYKEIRETLTDTLYLHSTKSILAMCEYKNTILRSDLNEICAGSSRKLESRPDWIYALESHEEDLYDAGRYGIYKNSKKIDTFLRIDDMIRVLCLHDEKVYAGGSTFTAKVPAFANIVEEGVVYDVSTGEKVATRDSEVYALCSFKGRLLDGGGYGKVMDTFSNKNLLDFGNTDVTALKTIPFALVKKLIKTS